MKRTIRLTESELHGLIRECIEEIIHESRQPLTEAFQSSKLTQLVKQHGGFLYPQWKFRQYFGDDFARSLSLIKDDAVLGAFPSKGNANTYLREEGLAGTSWFKLIPMKDGYVILIDDGKYNKPGTQKPTDELHRQRINNRDMKRHVGINDYMRNYTGYDNGETHFDNPHAQELLHIKQAQRWGEYPDTIRFSPYDENYEGEPEWNDYRDVPIDRDGRRTMNRWAYLDRHRKRAKKWHQNKMAQGPNPAFK